MGQLGEGGDSRDLTVIQQRVVDVPPDATEAVAELVRVAFGLVAVGLGVVLRTFEPPLVTSTHTVRGPGPPVTELADAVVGTAWGAARVTGRFASSGARVVRPVVSVVLRPPLLPRRLQPGRGIERLAEQWRRDRPDTVRSLAQWSATLVPSGIQAALRQVDVQACIDEVLDAVDLDAVVADVVERVDVDEVVEMLLARVDIRAVSAKALDQLDLNQLVLDRIDLRRVVEAALHELDLTHIVLDEVDLITVAEYVVAGIDLPEIIRASTGSMASETVRGLRMQGVGADQAVSRAVDRVLFRRAQRRPAPMPLTSQDRRAEDVEDPT
jgi:hypothetical protein